MAELYMQPKLRPCYIVGENNKRIKGLFHCWNHISEVICPSLMIGGHTGGVIAHTSAIVELADGSITNIRPESIFFLDSPFQDYMWEEKCDD